LRKKERVFVAVPIPFRMATAPTKPFFMRQYRRETLGLDVLRAYLKVMCRVFFTRALKSKDVQKRANAHKQMIWLTGHLFSLDQQQSAVAFGGMEPKKRSLFHVNNFSGADFVMAAFTPKTTPIDPLPLPKDRDITESPIVRTAFEPIRKKDTAVFQEELDSISAFQLGQRIVSKRYQFNGVHGNYMHSKLIVTETPEEIREIPDIDPPEIVENLSDPTTWIVNPFEQYVPSKNADRLGALIGKFNNRRSR